jgi:hypothetical protein
MHGAQLVMDVPCQQEAMVNNELADLHSEDIQADGDGSELVTTAAEGVRDCGHGSISVLLVYGDTIAWTGRNVKRFSEDFSLDIPVEV